MFHQFRDNSSTFVTIFLVALVAVVFFVPIPWVLKANDKHGVWLFASAGIGIISKLLYELFSGGKPET
jgi:hypothetical protein